MRSLQSLTLVFVSDAPAIRRNFVDLDRYRELSHLRIEGLVDGFQSVFPGVAVELKTLEIIRSEIDEFSLFGAVHKTITRLVLKDTRWKLYLYSEFSQLKELELVDEAGSQVLHFRASGFPRLTDLSIHALRPMGSGDSFTDCLRSFIANANDEPKSLSLTIGPNANLEYVRALLAQARFKKLESLFFAGSSPRTASFQAFLDHHRSLKNLTLDISLSEHHGRTTVSWPAGSCMHAFQT